MRWKEFKEKVELLGMRDENEIWYIDISFDDELNVFYDRELRRWVINN